MDDNYYSTTDVLTHVPLTPAEETSLFEAFYAGDLVARDKLLENNLRYAASIALNHMKHKGSKKDLISAANAGLIKALEARTFTLGKGRFTTFSTKYILGEIFALFRVSGSVVFPAGKLPDWPEDRHLDPSADTLPDTQAFVPEQLDHTTLREALAGLEDRERALLELLFFEGDSVALAARKLGLSRQWATELRDRSILKLRVALGVRTPAENLTEALAEEEAA